MPPLSIGSARLCRNRSDWTSGKRGVEMSRNLFHKRIKKRPPKVELGGRILLLTEDPALIRYQLEGNDLELNSIPPLRDDVSTDEIIPFQACLQLGRRLGEFVYTGLKCGSEFPIGKK